MMSRNSDGLQVVRTQVRFLHSVSCSVETRDLSVVKKWIRRTSCNKNKIGSPLMISFSIEHRRRSTDLTQCLADTDGNCSVASMND